MDEESKRQMQAALERGDLWQMRKILARCGENAPPVAPPAGG